MVGQYHNKYRGDETCYIVYTMEYYAILECMQGYDLYQIAIKICISYDVLMIYCVYIIVINDCMYVAIIVCVYIYIYIYHHVMPQARISQTLSYHFSLSFIASGWSSGPHPVSSHSCWMYVRAGRPAFARPYEGVDRSASLMSSFLLLQQCPASLVHLTWIVFVMGGRWSYSWYVVGCCRQDLFNIARSTLV